MKLENFNLVEDYAISYNGIQIDLHNNYDLADLHVHYLTRKFIMVWQLVNNEIGAAIPQTLELEFAGLQYLSITPRDPEMPFEEDRTLNEFGFIEASESNIENTTTNFRTNTDEHLVFSLNGGSIIRIYSDLAQIHVK